MTLSHADERGRSHLSLDARLRRTFVELPKGELAELARQPQGQAKVMVRHGGAMALIDPKFVMEGTDEQDALEKYYRELGMPVFHADPSELSLKGNEVLYEGAPIDICYGDYELRDIIALEAEGVYVTPLKHLFKTNRMVSSMAGDFEILTDPNWPKHFTPGEQEVFQRHVLWTRLRRECPTRGPEGWPVNLLEFTRRNRERLVIKPNRSYGGAGVLLGPSMEQAEWETAIQTALSVPNPGRVVQKMARGFVAEFPAVDADGAVHMSPFYFVIGFAATKRGLSIMGRASQRQVVNVAQRRGLCTVLVGRHDQEIVPPTVVGLARPASSARNDL